MHQTYQFIKIFIYRDCISEHWLFNGSDRNMF